MKHINLLSISIVLLLFSLVSCNKTQDQLVPVKLDGKWGYINSKGEYVIAPTFKDADFFYDGLAQVKTIEGNIGYIDQTGAYVIEPKYKFGTMFNENKAIIVEQGECPIVVDTKGTTLLQLKEVEYLYNFREGLAAFENADGKIGFINEQGATVIEPKYEAVHFGFSDGLAAVQQNGKWGFIDKTGKMVISAQFQKVGLFKDGLAPAAEDSVYGFIDKTGLFKVHPQFNDANGFSEGYASVKIGGKYGCIKSNGKIDVNPLYDNIGGMYNGMAIMQLGAMFGYINNAGEMAINAQFADASEFFGSFAIVKTFDQYGEYHFGIINKDGKYTSFPKFDAVKTERENYTTGDNFVESDYYDATEFIEKFGKKITDSSFDGFNANSTLESIANSSLYGDYANVSDTTSIAALNKQKFSKEIACIETDFLFSNPIVTIDSTNVTALTYKLDEKLATIFYTFDFTGKASKRGCAIAKALSKTISQKLGMTQVTRENVFYGIKDDNKCAYFIEYTQSSMNLVVSFNQNAINNIVKNIQQESQSNNE